MPHLQLTDSFHNETILCIPCAKKNFILKLPLKFIFGFILVKNLLNVIFAQKDFCKKYIFVLILGKRPFYCDMCRKVFARKNRFNYHLRCHSSEKHFKCHICEKSYKSEYNLNCHICIDEDNNFFM